MKESNLEIADILKRLNHFDISLFDESFLKRSLQKRLAENHCESIESYCSLLEQSIDERKIFITSLHVNYSEFFRNPLTFAVLENIIIPSILQKKKSHSRQEIRIWSAACASGQEAYSIAILSEEHKNKTGELLSYRIFATDQCDVEIDKSSKGNFTEADISNVNLRRLKMWFVENDSVYSVKQELKENIDFSIFNLFNEQLSSPPASIFGGFDIVFCSNLLFYYKKEYREIIIKKVGKSLLKDGYLVTGETERDIVMSYNYHEVYPQSCIFRIRE